MSWEPWQSMQAATRASPVARSWPWTLVAYFAYSSVASWYWAMRAASEWQLPQTPTETAFDGFPMKPACGDIATDIEVERGSPP